MKLGDRSVLVGKRGQRALQIEYVGVAADIELVDVASNDASAA